MPKFSDRRISHRRSTRTKNWADRIIANKATRGTHLHGQTQAGSHKGHRFQEISLVWGSGPDITRASQHQGQSVRNGQITRRIAAIAQRGEGTEQTDDGRNGVHEDTA